MVGFEAPWIVVEPRDGTYPVEQPPRTLTPGIPDQILAGASQPKRPGAIRGAGRQPPPIRAESTVQRPQCASQVENAFDGQSHRLHICIFVAGSGLRPAGAVLEPADPDMEDQWQE